MVKTGFRCPFSKKRAAHDESGRLVAERMVLKAVYKNGGWCAPKVTFRRINGEENPVLWEEGNALLKAMMENAKEQVDALWELRKTVEASDLELPMRRDHVTGYTRSADGVYETRMIYTPAHEEFVTIFLSCLDKNELKKQGVMY